MIYDLIDLIFTYDEIDDSEITVEQYSLSDYGKIGWDFFKWFCTIPKFKIYMNVNGFNDSDLGGFSFLFNEFKGFNDKPGIAIIMLLDFTLFGDDKTEEVRAMVYYDRNGKMKEVVFEKSISKNGFIFKINF